MKKGMKKILSVAIVLAMTMSLAACGGETKGWNIPNRKVF